MREKINVHGEIKYSEMCFYPIALAVSFCVTKLNRSKTFWFTLLLGIGTSLIRASKGTVGLPFTSV